MGKVISVFGSDPKFEEGFIKNGFDCLGVLCQTDDVRDAYRKHFENTITYIFDNPAGAQCSCGINNRKPHGIIGVLPNEEVREDGTGGKPQLIMDFFKMINISNKPEFFLLEYPDGILEDDKKGEFEFATNNFGNAGFDIFVQRYNNGRTFFVGFGQTDPVKDFEFPKEEESNEELDYDLLVSLISKSIKNTVTESGKKVEELFKPEEPKPQP